MTLGFSTNWPAHMGALAGQPNYFIERIYNGLEWIKIKIDYFNNRDKHFDLFGKYWDNAYPKGCGFRKFDHGKKIHTIRAGNRWKAGMLIHPVINNRTKDRFQFAPTMNCEAVQKIEIQWHQIGDNMVGATYCGYRGKKGFEALVIVCAHQMLSLNEITTLAINDGFESVEDFFAYFDKGFKGQIIHWTDLRY